MPEEPIQIVEHTADWSIRIVAADLARLFEYAAMGMAALLVEVPSSLPCTVERTITLDAFDKETLLVDWLSELAYLAESEQLVPCAVELLTLSETGLLAQVGFGQAPSVDKHIKAVTYHNLAIQPLAQGFEVTIVFDV